MKTGKGFTLMLSFGCFFLIQVDVDQNKQVVMVLLKGRKLDLRVMVLPATRC